MFHVKQSGAGPVNNMVEDVRCVITARLFREEKCFGPGIAELLHPGAALAAVVAAALHGHRQLVGPAEGTDKQRYQNGQQGLGPLQAIAGLYPDHLPLKEGRKTGAFDKVCGSSYVRETFAARHRVEDIREYWEADAASFRAMSSGYYLYQ